MKEKITAKKKKQIVTKTTNVINRSANRVHNSNLVKIGLYVLNLKYKIHY